MCETCNWVRENNVFADIACPFFWSEPGRWESYWPEVRGTPDHVVMYGWDTGGDDAHNEGGNYGYVDGHAKWVKRVKAAAGAVNAAQGGATDPAEILWCMRMWGHEYGCGYDAADHGGY